MGAIGQELVDSRFSDQSTSVYNLSVLVGTDRLSYFIRDAQQHVLFLKSYDFQGKDDPATVKEILKSVYLQDDLIKRTFKKSLIGIVDVKQTFVPDRLFEDSKKAIYLEQLLPHIVNSEVGSDYLTELEFHNVYELSQQAVGTMRNFFSDASIYHVYTGLIKGFQKHASLRSGHQLYINVRHRHLQLFVYDQGQFVFGNGFDFQTSEDFIYYIMLVFDQLDLKPELVPVNLAGQITEQSQIYRMLYRYIRHLNMVKSPDFLQLGDIFQQVPGHFYYDLYSLQLCES